MQKNTTDLWKFISLAGGILLLLGLSFLAYRGIFNRFWADDWCYKAHLREMGLWGTLNGYFYITQYASNRFSLTLFSGFFYPLGIIGTQILPALVITLMLLGVYFLLNNINRIFMLAVSKLQLLLLTTAIVYFTFFLAPNQFQLLYWLSGVLPYTFPIIFTHFLLILITNTFLKEKPMRLARIVVPIVSLLAGGFSEVGAAYLTTGLFLLLVGFLIIQPRHKKQLRSNAIDLTGLGLSLLFVLIATAILILSPANKLRATSYGEPATIPQLLSLPWIFALHIVRDTIKGYPIPLSILSILIAGTAFLVSQKTQRPNLSWSSAIKLLGVITVFCFILIAASLSPSVYIEKSIGGGRAQFWARYTILIWLFLVSYIGGGGINKIFQVYPPKVSKSISLVCLFAILGCFVYIGRSILNIFEPIPVFQKRAQVWDERENTIERGKLYGETEIDVRQIDSYAEVLELNDPPNWLNDCAADYYGVEKINSVLPW